MGLLTNTDADGRVHRLPGYGALAKADVADAKRRRPAGTLDEWAAARGLDALGSQNAAGYFAALPLDDQLQFNVVRGVLPGGRDGCLFHWLRAWPCGEDGEPSGGGRWFGTYWGPGVSRGWWKKMIPLVGDLLSSDVELAIGVPFTVAATLVPEAATCGRFTIGNGPKALFSKGGRELGGGFRLEAGEALPETVVERLLAPGSPLPPVLAAAGAAHARFELHYDAGTLMARHNGFAADPEALDALCEQLCAIAEALAAAALPEAEPRPFSAALPVVDWPPSGISMSGRFPPSPWLEALHGLAGELGMTLEEPDAYHRAFPHVAVPGRAFAVLHGVLPGTATSARIAFHRERPLSDNQGRTALLLPAAPGAQETPPWGMRLREPRLGYAVRDGIVAIWVQRSSGRNGDLGDIPGLLRTAYAFALERGLVAA